MNTNNTRITLAHGEGARATRELITNRILTRFDNEHLRQLSDATQLDVASDRIAMTTDSFVVSPMIFPGGDIGSMAVYGTVNDLAVSGAVPRWLSLALIIEEGLELSILDKILDSIASAAERCGVVIVTGDTKVVPRGAADGIFINTTGIGELNSSVIAGPRSIRAGDLLIVSGPIGRHGIAVLSAREELALEPPPQSDSAPLHNSVACLRKNVGEAVKAIRDATRGGVSAVLHEWATECNLTMQLDETRIPITDDVRGASELLGLDPLYIANEGTMVIAVDPAAEAEALAALRSIPESHNAVVIGRVTARKVSPVTIQRMLGVEQPVDEPTGALLPRIC
ncbi:MAG: hydrogenase expression/formation protein HypE [Fuerstiella sp.]